MKKRVKSILIAVALLSIAMATISGVGAYFTDRTAGSQSHAIRLGDTTTVQEEYNNWFKMLTVTNSASSDQAVWVRMRAYAPNDAMQQNLSYESVSGWSQRPESDGWCYYQIPVLPGESTSQFRVGFAERGGSTVLDLFPEARENATFNIVVVYETVPALDLDGTETCQSAFAAASTV